MKLYSAKDGRQFAVRSTKKPKMKSGYFGRTWDCLPKFVDGVGVNFYCDTNRGRNMYFTLNGKWYVVSIFDDFFDAMKLVTKI